MRNYLSKGLGKANRFRTRPFRFQCDTGGVVSGLGLVNAKAPGFVEFDGASGTRSGNSSTFVPPARHPCFSSPRKINKPEDLFCLGEQRDRSVPEGGFLCIQGQTCNPGPVETNPLVQGRLLQRCRILCPRDSRWESSVVAVYCLRTPLLHLWRKRENVNDFLRLFS